MNDLSHRKNVWWILTHICFLQVLCGTTPAASMPFLSEQCLQNALIYKQFMPICMTVVWLLCFAVFFLNNCNSSNRYQCWKCNPKCRLQLQSFRHPALRSRLCWVFFDRRYLFLCSQGCSAVPPSKLLVWAVHALSALGSIQSLRGLVITFQFSKGNGS